MYVPPSFAESDPAVLFDLMERYSFALLVSTPGGEPFATHLPLVLDRTAGPHGTLLGHVARANPHWRSLVGQPVLAVFSGPHAYVSPTWYATDHMVPTWNYVAVHAYATAELVEDRGELLALLARSVAVYEAGQPHPWELDTHSPAVDRLLGQIVGFRLRVERLEGKWKLSQNHPAERRERVIAALRESGGEAATVAEWMAARSAAADLR